MKKLALLLCLALVVMTLAPAAMAQEVVNVYNWFDYIDPSVYALFEQETGIHVNATYFTTNEDMLVQVRNSPGAFDVLFPSDYAIERMLAEGLLQTIDFEAVPNNEYTMDMFRTADYDPTGEYSVPYMWGTVGILYNTSKTDEEIDSWEAIFSDRYKGEVFMLDSQRDSIGVALKYLGYSMNTRNPVELQAATQLLIKQKQSGIVKAYQVDETKEKMANGEGTLAVMWSGDALYAMDLNEDLAYVVPKEGSNVWVDAMVIPASAKNKQNAEKFINFLCRPDIAQLNCEYIWYSSPNTGAIELMGEDYTENTSINPSDETVASCEFFHDIEDVKVFYDTLWGTVKNAK